jgi:hypothetical protein
MGNYKIKKSLNIKRLQAGDTIYFQLLDFKEVKGFNDNDKEEVMEIKNLDNDSVEMIPHYTVLKGIDFEIGNFYQVVAYQKPETDYLSFDVAELDID